MFSSDDILFRAEVIMFSSEHKLLSDTVIMLSSDDILKGQMSVCSVKMASSHVNELVSVD
jgi:hypothetical protein